MPKLPFGTLTLLFTDIESSTRLLQDLGERYEEVLSDHRRLLRSCFEKKGGSVVDTQGDAFFVAFARAQAAVAAAVEAQHVLSEHDWPGATKLRVRMGIHTGEPSQVGEGLVGVDVHRAARICSAGHGGQILLSATTRDLVADHLPSGVVLFDLGEHRLKGLDRPEVIAQVVMEGVPPILAPLRTPETQPLKATPFAGQEEQLAAAAQAAIAGTRRHVTPVRIPQSAVERVRALDWRQYVRMPGRDRFADRLEGLGPSIHASARIAPRDDLAAELRGLGKAIVVAARNARGADELLHREDRGTIARRLAYHRNSSAWTGHLRAADALAKQLAELSKLAESRREFAKDARKLEPSIRALRGRLFDARLSSDKADELVLELRTLREAAEAMAARLHEAYGSATSASGEAATLGGRERG